MHTRIHTLHLRLSHLFRRPPPPALPPPPGSIEITGKARSTITLHGRPGKRSLLLEYVNGSSLEETWALVNLWFRALSFVLYGGGGGGGDGGEGGGEAQRAAGGAGGAAGGGLSPRTLARVQAGQDAKRVRDPSQAALKGAAMREWVAD